MGVLPADTPVWPPVWAPAGRPGGARCHTAVWARPGSLCGGHSDTLAGAPDADHGEGGERERERGERERERLCVTC